MTPSADQIAAALAHAAESQPLEACGVIADGDYFRIRNLATEHDVFSMDMRAFRDVAAAHQVEAVVHSHVHRAPMAGEADRAACERTGLPWLIVSWPAGGWTVIEPCGWKAPLVGRQWAWGTHDCWGLVRDGLEQYAGIRTPDFDRDWLWWTNGGDIIAEHFAEAGFRQLPYGTEPQHCDVLGMRIHSRVINHLGLFLHPDVILHQVMGQLSRRDVYGGTYAKATGLHLRHERLMGGAPPC